MAQHDYDINSTDSISGYQFRQDTNSALSAIKSTNSGITAPVSPVAGMLWYDTSTTPNKLKVRNEGNTDWLDVYVEAKLGATIASASTTTIGQFGYGEIFHISGVTTITSFANAVAGTRRVLIFDSALTLTHNASLIICPGATSITTIAGMVVTVICEGGTPSVWRIVAILHPSISSAEIGYLDGVTSGIQSQLNTKAPLASPVFTGNPTAPTPTTGDNDTSVATTAFVTSALPYLTYNTTSNMTLSGNDEFSFMDSTDSYSLHKISFVGLRSAMYNTTGAANTTNIGTNALGATTGSGNSAFGSNALVSNTGGIDNNSFGAFSLQANINGSYSNAFGHSALYNSTGSYNTAFGHSTLWNNTTGYMNTAFGYEALSGGTIYINASGFGYNAQVTGSNQVQLGNSSTTTYVYGTVQNRSDLRDKADVRDTIFGLDFINTIRPVDYRWDMREFYKPEPFNEVLAEDATKDEVLAYNTEKAKWLNKNKLSNCYPDGSKKRTRFHHGLIAQELQSAFPEFGGLQDHSISGGEDVLSIGYDELIAPMIKAIQELTQKVKLLEEANATRL